MLSQPFPDLKPLVVLTDIRERLTACRGEWLRGLVLFALRAGGDDREYGALDAIPMADAKR
ncbi:hypothetical protein [uncultured Thiodictyon sp.]|uniref:hypothetical protein n=1 Tax=uncultured Thiodictyon sp. TaxID=1846217 RepID=UPI0025FEEA9E|nr:hypothetical protein [uncultured Thiodictyon sp.]